MKRLGKITAALLTLGFTGMVPTLAMARPDGGDRGRPEAREVRRDEPRGQETRVIRDRPIVREDRVIHEDRDVRVIHDGPRFGFGPAVIVTPPAIDFVPAPVVVTNDVDQTIGLDQVPPAVIQAAEVEGNGRGIEAVEFVSTGGVVTYQVHMGAPNKVPLIVTVGINGRILGVARL